MRTPPRLTLVALVAALGVLASACGSGSDTTSIATAPAAGATSSAAETAETNIDNLAPNDDVRLVEVLEVTSGEISTLAAATDGDRPVLLWFWAPH